MWGWRLPRVFRLGPLIRRNLIPPGSVFVFAAIATPQGAAYSNAGIIDLGFFSTLPFLPYSQPEAWITHLESFEQTDYETFIPGHSKLGAKDDLALQRSYFEVLEDLVSAVVTSGGSQEDALKIDLPEPFDSWLYGGMGRFEANVNFLYERLSKEA